MVMPGQAVQFSVKNRLAYYGRKVTRDVQRGSTTSTSSVVIRSGYEESEFISDAVNKVVLAEKFSSVKRRVGIFAG